MSDFTFSATQKADFLAAYATAEAAFDANQYAPGVFTPLYDLLIDMIGGPATRDATGGAAPTLPASDAYD